MRTPVIVIGALSLIGLGAVILKSVSADADGCSASGIRLTVAADPAIAPVIAEIGTAWTATRPSIEGDCVRVDVVAKPSYEVATELGTYSGGLVDVAAKPVPTPSDADLPTVWIPESSYWLGRVRAIDRDMFDTNILSVASSPIVLAVPEAVARGMEKELGQGIDAAIIKKLALDPAGKLKLGLVEPRRDTAGMVGAMVLSDAVVASPADLPVLVKVYRTLGGAVNDVNGLWQAMGDGSKGMNGAPVSEQALLTHNAGASATPMAAVPLADAATLDFPYAARARQPRQVAAAAAAFRSALTSPQNKALLAQHRLRAADGTAGSGFPTGHGVTAGAIHLQPLTDMAKVKSALAVWVSARTASRVVAMVDATSSMALPLNGTAKSRMQVMKEAATTGLTFFTAESKLGLWAFVGKGHTNLVPLETIGPAGSTQRNKLIGAVTQANPVPGVDACPLYQSIIAGYQEMLNGYDPALSNTLVVFTDGRDTTGTDIRKVQRELELLADVTRPIRVVLLGIGPDIKLDELQAIADTTGGAAFQVNSPEQMQLIFLTALLA
ncbi:hypothetical protein Rhe02_97800 [Rhizocola hellebori]|uniref:VWFA domain-containing protein n=1 Tax=Rhizocola hellebori TaxID=1392758 RepID=A0A8J3VN15_9ACTN|nr:VWA domain-containing protein [Rhizocola hellebori]GIH11713.1 hypothetical protein Rhe02_97800 [Rhizocola hellebori]